MTKLTTDIYDRDIDEHLKKFIMIAQYKNLAKRFSRLGDIAQNGQMFMPFIMSRFSVEMGLFELIQHYRNTGRFFNGFDSLTDKTSSAISFAVAVGQVYSKISAAAQNRLRGMVVDGLKSDSGVGPLKFELETSVHLTKRNFEVDFLDLETGGGFDYLVHKGGKSFEVECKHVSSDIGKMIKMRRMLLFVSALQKPVEKIFREIGGGVCLKIVMKGELLKSDKYVLELVAQTCNAIRECRNIESNKCIIHAYSFDRNANGFDREMPPDELQKISESLCYKLTGSEPRIIAMLHRSMQGSFIFSFESDRADRTVQSLIHQLKDAARDQLTKSRPGMLFVRMGEMDDELLLRGVRGGKTAFGPIAAAVFGTRPHVLSLTFVGRGGIRRFNQERRAVNPLPVASVEGASYITINTAHPLANDATITDELGEAERV